MLPAFRLARTLGLKIRIEVSRATKSLRILFEDETALDVSRRGVRLATATKPVSQAMTYADAFAVSMGWTPSGGFGWPFAAPKAPGDMVAAPIPELINDRARRLRAARIDILSNGDETDRRVRSLLDRFMVLEHPPTGEENALSRKGGEVLLFLTGASLGNCETSIRNQMHVVAALKAEHPGARGVFPMREAASLGSASLDRLQNRLLEREEELASRRNAPVQPVQRGEAARPTPGAVGQPAHEPGDHNAQTISHEEQSHDGPDF